MDSFRDVTLPKASQFPLSPWSLTLQLLIKIPHHMENIHPRKALHFSYASRGTENLSGTVRLLCKSYICKIIRLKCGVLKILLLIEWMESFIPTAHTAPENSESITLCCLIIMYLAVAFFGGLLQLWCDSSNGCSRPLSTLLAILWTWLSYVKELCPF